MEFHVSLESFEGPLDLMLHLVHTSRLDLFELNLDRLATQYLDYIRSALSQGLDVSSEYLVEFTSLMEYKSRALLPNRQDPEAEDSYEEDPAVRMAMRLREYERCKQSAALLAALHAARENHFDREPASQIDEWAAPSFGSTKLSLKSSDLQRVFLRVMRRYQILQPYQTQVEVRELSVEERMSQILERKDLDEQPLSFESLLADTATLREAVVTFLALLELVHEGLLCAWTASEDEIWIQRSQKMN